MIAALIRRLGALVLLTSAGSALHLIGQVLEQPPLADPTRWPEADPVLLATTLVGAVAMAACAWLALLTAIESLALILNLHPLRRLALILAPAAWRSLVLRPVAIVTMALPPLAMPVVAAAPAIASTVPGPELGADGESAPQLEMRPFHAGQATPTLTMRYVGPEPELAPDPSLTPVLVENPALSSSGPVRVVAPGENLWSIASAHLAEVSGARPSSVQVTNYWKALIEGNRHVLPDAENPDLIYQGLELTMPALG